MAKYKVTTKNKIVQPINDTHYDTMEKMRMNNTVLSANSNASYEVINYHLQILNLTFYQNTGLMSIEDNTLMSECSFSFNSCYSNDSVIIWTYIR